jgi:adenylate cyclase
MHQIRVNSINASSVQQIRARVNKTLAEGIQIDMSTEESKKLLRRHVKSKTHIAIMFIDINGSTEMSFSLPDDKFATIIQTFAQETSIAVTGYGGYVFKYEGDAVISLFPAEYDQAKACRNALDCSKAVLEIIRGIVNPAFRINGLPEITIRTGLAYGEALVLLYGKNPETAHIDIVGSSISMAAKIASTAKPNQILVGELIYNILLLPNHEDAMYYKHILREVSMNQEKWKYPSRFNNHNIYRVYEYLETY